jgi:hypothetical protein
MESAMRRHWRLFGIAVRAALWRATADPPVIGLAGLVGWSVVTLALLVLPQYQAPDSAFTEYGLALTAGALALSLTASALVLPREIRVTACAAMLLAALIIVSAAFALLVLANLADISVVNALWMRAEAYIAGAVLLAVWLVGAYAAVIRSLDPERRYAHLRRAVAVLAVQAVVTLAYPHSPMFLTPEMGNNPPNAWTFVRSLFKEDEPNPARVDGARVELAQPALMEEAIARLKPQVPGETDVYAIGIAGFAEQDVFVKELDGALAALGKVLAIGDRTVQLVNHVDRVERTPVAARLNFAAAVRAIARVLDPDEDVLLVFMTSHGTRDGVVLRLPGLIRSELAPQDVADVLDREGIKNRLVVVSACYGGVFVKPLANDDTIVLTAADENSTSFGCSNEREWTYFGDAFFNQSLRPDTTLEQAFADAKARIAEWEARDRLPPSNPQGHFGSALTAKLAPIYGASRHAERRQAPRP